MRSRQRPAFLLVAAGLGAALATLVALYFLGVAVALPLLTADRYGDKLQAEALLLATSASLGYAAVGLIQYIRGRGVRWALVAGAYVIGALATPFVLLELITFSGG